MNASFRRLVAGFGLLILATWFVPAVGASDADWSSTVAQARGQTLYWNAWGGDDGINAYLAWGDVRVDLDGVGDRLRLRVSDHGPGFDTRLAEKSAGRSENGSVDLIWINGENFAAMKEHGLLYGPFTQRLPNFRLVDTEGKPTLTDFTVPVDGLEAPWSMAQFVFLYDTARLVDRHARHKLLAWVKAHQGGSHTRNPRTFWAPLS
jgi:putative thiamine transport system substrate-binding protein